MDPLGHKLAEFPFQIGRRAAAQRHGWTNSRARAWN